MMNNFRECFRKFGLIKYSNIFFLLFFSYFAANILLKYRRFVISTSSKILGYINNDDKWKK